MQKLSSLSATTALASAILLLLIIQINAAPMPKQVRLLHFSGQYITVDPNTGSVTASSSTTDDTTLFFEEDGPSRSRRFRSAVLLDRYLSLVKNDTSAHYALTALQTVSSGQSGSSRGSEGSTSGSGASEREMESSSVATFHNWQINLLSSLYSAIRISVSDNVNCYLAFDEFTGEPVADPCSILPNDKLAHFTIE